MTRLARNGKGPVLNMRAATQVFEARSAFSDLEAQHQPS